MSQHKYPSIRHTIIKDMWAATYQKLTMSPHKSAKTIGGKINKEFGWF